MPHPILEEPEWILVPNTSPIQYTRPLLGSEFVHDVAHRLNDGLGETCMGVSFSTRISPHVIRTRTLEGIGRLRFISPILACSIFSDPEDNMKRSWTYSSPSDLSAWMSDTLTIRTEPVDPEAFILELNSRRLPYVHSDGHQQQVHFYLLIGEHEEHMLFMHGPHSIMDARPVLRGFDLLLEWIAQPPPDPTSSLSWGTEWRNLPAGPMRATGGSRSDWDTIGLSLMQEMNEIRANSVPSLTLRPSPSREFVAETGRMIRAHETLDLATSTQIVQTIKALGYSMSHLADAALTLSVFDSNPGRVTSDGAHFTLDPTLISQDKFLTSSSSHSHFISGLCTVPVRVPYSEALLQGSRRHHLLAIMDIIKMQYNHYVGNPNLPHLLSAQLALHPIREARVFRDPCTPLTSNIGRVETFLKSKWAESQTASEKPIVDVVSLSVGHRLGWKRPMYHLWSLQSQIHLQIQASDVWDRAVIEKQLETFRSNILLVMSNEDVRNIREPLSQTTHPATAVPRFLPDILAPSVKIATNMDSAADHFTPTIHHNTYPAIDPLQSDMTGKIVFISGASKGIGRAAAISFARAGATGIVIAARSEDLLVTAEEELVRIDRSHLGQPPVVVMRATMDISDRDSVELVAVRTRAFFGKVDILLNVAAVVDRAHNISESAPDDWSSTLNTNLRGTYIVTRAMLPLMTNAHRDSNRMIVNLVSAAIHLSTSRSTAYTLSKLALLRMSEMLHLDYGGAPHDITVIGFHPGYVFTDLTKTLPADVQRRVLVDSPELAADSLVWLARESRPWLSGRYISCNWDVSELEEMKKDILAEDKLKLKMVI